ncbi:hypothetical protein RHMOL_Rhmol03G0271300 [Rhododendron molle]|uniref:Uncharacterized protein n=1 Tax=Rhododendron molle TaxID=49168 RepID=A0ACC0PIN1_RHOML|nr:hypothetical protein RHMOL_Rhmol03G0271300 [Rhododendron molle]
MDLQRSVTSYRRSGSSGLVWDEKLYSGELKRVPRPKDEADDDQEKGETKSSVPNRPSQVRVEQRQHNSMYRTMKEDRPAMEPPSPKVSGCGFCGMFGNSEKTRNRNRANRKR